MRVTLIQNPGAGDGEYPKEQLIRIMREIGYQVRYRSAKGDLRAAVRVPADLIVAAGGDGTIGDVLKLMAGRLTPFTAIPIGTANNIGLALRLTQPPPTLIAKWDRLPMRQLHLGSVRGASRMSFVESVGVGLFAELLNQEKGSTESKGSRAARLRRAVRQLLKLAKRLKPSWWDLTVDGRDVSGDYLLVEAMNIRSIGPNLVLAPSANPYDRFLDVVMVRDDEREALLDYLNRVLHSPGEPARFRTSRGSQVRLAGDRGVFHIDDQPQRRRGRLVIELTVAKRTVPMLVRS